MNILIVEDEKQLNDLLYDYILEEFPQAAITQCYDGIIALETINTQTFELILLDVMLPHMNGFEICKHIRKKHDMPIIMLSALSDEENQLKGFNLGIDDYVTKPYSPKIVVKKIKSVLSRYEQHTPNQQFTYGVITYQLDNQVVKVENTPVKLNKKEWELFSLFIKHPGRIYTRDELLNLIWGYDYMGYDRTIDTHIKRLRQKLGTASQYVKTVYKTGYKFEK